jgi:hypothetical protein
MITKAKIIGEKMEKGKTNKVFKRKSVEAILRRTGLFERI